MSKTNYSRRDISLLANVPDDVLSFWLRRGVLLPVEQTSGKGHHRVFDRAEVSIAALLMVARDAGLNIGALGRLAEQARAACRLRQSVAAPSRWFCEMVNIIGGDTDDLQFFIDNGYMTEADRSAILAAATKLSHYDLDKLWLGEAILNDPVPLVLYEAGSQCWQLRIYGRVFGENGPDQSDSHDFYLVLNFQRICPEFDLCLAD